MWLGILECVAVLRAPLPHPLLSTGEGCSQPLAGPLFNLQTLRLPIISCSLSKS